VSCLPVTGSAQASSLFDEWRIREQNLRLLADRLKKAGRIGIGARRLRGVETNDLDGRLCKGGIPRHDRIAPF
jgi:hypothetical protein